MRIKYETIGQLAHSYNGMIERHSHWKPWNLVKLTGEPHVFPVWYGLIPLSFGVDVFEFAPDNSQWNSQAKMTGTIEKSASQLTLCYRVKIYRYLPSQYYVNLMEYTIPDALACCEIRSRECDHTLIHIWTVKFQLEKSPRKAKERLDKRSVFQSGKKSYRHSRTLETQNVWKRTLKMAIFINSFSPFFHFSLDWIGSVDGAEKPIHWPEWHSSETDALVPPLFYLWLLWHELWDDPRRGNHWQGPFQFEWTKFTK